MQDELLIRRAQRGDADAFEQLLLEHQKNVYNLCYRMAGNPDDAMDLSQETFLRAWRCLDQYQFASAFSTWLYRLCSNICIDFLRRRRRQQTVPLTFEDADGEEQTYAVPDAQPLPEEQVELKLTRETLAAAMAQLLPEHRAVLQLRVVNEMSYEQIADVLDIQIGTVKSRLSRARNQLKKILERGNLSRRASSESMEGEVAAKRTVTRRWSCSARSWTAGSAKRSTRNCRPIWTNVRTAAGSMGRCGMWTRCCPRRSWSRQRHCMTR